MTKADEMRKLAAQNQKPKTQKVDYYDEALRNVYFGQFYSDVQYCAQNGKCTAKNKACAFHKKFSLTPECCVESDL